MIQNSVDVWVQEADASNAYGGGGGSHSYNDLTQERREHEMEIMIPSDDEEIDMYDDDMEMEQDLVPTLSDLCSQVFAPEDDSEEAKREADASWDALRVWLQSHTADEVHTEIQQRDDLGKTILHHVCMHSPPDDIIDTFVMIGQDVIRWKDSYGLLPIHYASGHSSSQHVIKSLTTAYPQSKTIVDRQGRTPLHCAWGPNHRHTATVVQILADSGAAGYEDDSGMLVSFFGGYGGGGGGGGWGVFKACVCMTDEQRLFKRTKTTMTDFTHRANDSPFLS